MAAGATVNHLFGDSTPLDIALISDRGGYEESDTREERRAMMVEILEAAGGLRAQEVAQLEGSDDDDDDDA